MTRPPAFQFYTGDWRKCTELQALDHEHKGVWIDLLCMMFDCSERGKLVLPNGSAMPDDAIARNLGIPEAEWKQKRSTFLAYGVASENEDGIFYNRRMVRDEEVRQGKVEAGRKGGTVSRPPSKTEANGGSSTSTSTAPSTAIQTTSAEFSTLWKLVHELCLLNRPNEAKEASSRSVLEQWLRSGKKPDSIEAFIRGARILVEAGEVDWIKPGEQFGLAVGCNQHTIDGGEERDLYAVAVDAHYRSNIPDIDIQILGVRA